MYNDYPGCSESYDDNRSIDQARLDYAMAKRAVDVDELGQLAAEGDSYTVLGHYHPNIDDARFVRGLAIDRRIRELARLDAAITAITIEILGDFEKEAAA